MYYIVQYKSALIYIQDNFIKDLFEDATFHIGRRAINQTTGRRMPTDHQGLLHARLETF